MLLKKEKTVAMFTQEMEAYEVYERMIANQTYIMDFNKNLKVLKKHGNVLEDN